MSGLITNVLSAFFFTITFVTSLLVHIHQKEKVALEIAAKVASVNGPLVHGATVAIWSLDHRSKIDN